MAAAVVKLTDLLAGLDGARIFGEARDVSEIRDDSRLVAAGDLFVAVSGAAADGRAFLDDAVARQAGVLVLERSAVAGESAPTVRAGVPPEFRGTVVTVPHARHALAVIAANRFATSGALTLNAVTGTNGKTTTTYLIESMLDAAGIPTGVIGTVAYRVGRVDSRAAGPGNNRGDSVLSRPAPLTTPGALALHGLFADMRDAGATEVILEASSHALEQARLDGCRFRVAGLTNVTQDHLDYHGSMERYFDAKAILFERLLDRAAGVAVLPVDLPEGRAMRARVTATGGGGVLGIAVTPGTPGADVVVESAAMSAEGMRIHLATPRGPLSLTTSLVGAFNLANVVLAVGMAIGRGLDAAAIATGLERLKGVPGRLERVPNEANILCVVDYAHTPDALERALAAMRPLVAPGARLITVFGCGGDRDRTKRPLMGRAAAVGSELAIVTSDNPRGEDPEAIIAMIVEGIRPQHANPLRSAADLMDWSRSAADAGSTTAGAYHVEADRRLAIGRAVSVARARDVVLIAGKGHEDYQIIANSRVHFDDREEASAAFAARARVGGNAPRDEGRRP